MGPNGILGSPLAGGALQNLPANATQDQVVVVMNDVINRLNGMLKSQVFSDGTNKRMFIGYQVGGWGVGKDFGIKISAPGYDVLTCADNELLFKMDIETWYWYDKQTQKNYMQVGTLPNGDGGFVVSARDKDVTEVM